MRTKTQLENKKAELEQWLLHNPTHVNVPEVQHDLREVINDLMDLKKNV